MNEQDQMIIKSLQDRIDAMEWHIQVLEDHINVVNQRVSDEHRMVSEVFKAMGKTSKLHTAIIAAITPAALQRDARKFYETDIKDFPGAIRVNRSKGE